MPFAELAERWRAYEALGLDTVWACDHLHQPSRPDGPYYEGWTVLSALAARTGRIRVGMLVSANTFRHPALLAQAAVTVDHVSGGRLELGIGTGWFAEEHRQLGLPLGTPGERLARLAEALPIVDALLRGETATFAGRFYTVDGAFVQPRPLQQPRPPITLGAHRPGMLRLAARHADRWNSYGTVEEIRERMRVLDEHCAELGRDPAEIRRSVYCWSAQAERQGLPDPWSSAAAFEEVVERYRAVGVDELVFDQPRAEQLPVLERVASDVIPQLR